MGEGAPEYTFGYVGIVRKGGAAGHRRQGPRSREGQARARNRGRTERERTERERREYKKAVKELRQAQERRAREEVEAATARERAALKRARKEQEEPQVVAAYPVWIDRLVHERRYNEDLVKMLFNDYPPRTTMQSFKERYRMPTPVTPMIDTGEPGTRTLSA